MSLVRRVFAHQRIADTHAAWAILRAQNAHIVLTILEYRLAGEHRRVPAPELFEQVTEDLEELRSAGFELPRTVQDYVSDWRRAGIVIRRPSTDTREETFELSPGALAAMQFVDELHTPRRTVTESRLATIQNLMSQLVMETDPDIASPLATEPSLWRMRLLDEALQFGPLSDISAPLNQLAQLDIAPSRVLIVENLISLLTLPSMANTVAIFGRGTAVPELAKLPWLHSAEVYYWGDLDTHGLRILHTLRAAGIQTTSVLMDLPTLQQFQDLWANESSPLTGGLELLTLEEAEAYDYLRSHRGTRLEQERIEWSHVLKALQDQGLLTKPLD